MGHFIYELINLLFGVIRRVRVFFLQDLLEDLAIAGNSLDILWCQRVPMLFQPIFKFAPIFFQNIVCHYSPHLCFGFMLDSIYNLHQVQVANLDVVNVIC